MTSMQRRILKSLPDETIVDAPVIIVVV